MSNTTQDGSKTSKSIASNFIWNATLKLFGVLFPLITFPYATRCLGAEQLGRVSFAESIISYFSLCANLGIPTYGIRACAMVRDNKIKLSRVVHEILFINIITTVVTYIILGISIICIPKLGDEKNLILVLSISLIFSCMGMEWLYSAVEEYRYITIRSLVLKILSLICLFLFVKAPSDYIKYAGITVMAAVGSNVFNLIRAKKIILFSSVGHYNLTRHFRPILTFFASSVAILIYTNIDVSMLGFMSSNTEVGYYTVAVKLKNVFLAIITSIGIVLLPRITYYYANNKNEAVNLLIAKSIHMFALISMPLTVFFELNAGVSIEIIGGTEYSPAQSSMMILMPLLVVVGFSNILVYQFILPLGMEKQYCYVTIISAVTDIIVNYILIPECGAFGAAVGTLAAELIGMVILCVLLRKHLASAFINVNISAVLVGVVIAGVGQKVFANFIWNPVNPFVRIVTSSSIFVVIYGSVLLALKDELIWEMLGKVRGFLSRFFKRG